MSFQKFKCDPYCVRGRHRYSTIKKNMVIWQVKVVVY